MMNILIVNYEYPPLGAGAATQNAYLAEMLASDGHLVVQVSTAFGELPAYRLENDVHVYRIKSWRKKQNQSNMLEMLSFVALAWLKLGKIVRKHRIDKAIVFFSIPCGPLGLWLKWRLGIPYIISLRGGDVPGYDVNLDSFHRILAPIRRHILRRAMAVVANSQSLAKLSEKADYVPTKVINNGVDTQFYYPVENSTDSDEIRFLFVGRLHAIKNTELLMAWATEMSRKYQHFRLHIYGQGPEEMRIRHLIMQNQLQNHVQIHNWVSKPELLEIYRAAQVFVNPSYNEGMPNTVMEAMACGLPVIATRVAGNKDLISHRENGLLFESNDLAAFLQLSHELMQKPELRINLGKKAGQSIVQQFSVQAMSQQYLQLLSDEFIK